MTRIAELYITIAVPRPRPSLARRVPIVRVVAQALAPERCPYCGDRVRVRLRYHVATWH